MSRVTINYVDENGEHITGWFDPDHAVEAVTENREWNEIAGSVVSLVAGVGAHECLYRTPKGRWVIYRWSDEPGPDTAVYATDGQAKDWLLRNGSEDMLKKYFAELPEEVGPGRPEIGGAVHVRLGDLLPQVDAWGAVQGVTRAEAVRRLVSAGLNVTLPPNE